MMVREKSRLQPLNLRVGDWVDARSAQEVLATLDDHGRLDGLPFMPEMLKHCGKRFKVFKRADKTCDTVEGTNESRRMANCVHLQMLRCDGSSHGGCQAQCLLFWKEAWLKPIDKPEKPSSPEPSRHTNYSEADLWKAAIRKGAEGMPDLVFSCQATELWHATTRLVWWDPRQYLAELLSGNASFLEVIKSILIQLFNFVQRVRGGCSYPHLNGRLKKTPSATLDLRPGEWVTVKSKEEIVQTLDGLNRNRGLGFDREMVPYCGVTARVLTRVQKIIDEKQER